MRSSTRLIGSEGHDPSPDFSLEESIKELAFSIVDNSTYSKTNSGRWGITAHRLSFSEEKQKGEERY